MVIYRQFHVSHLLICIGAYVGITPLEIHQNLGVRKTRVHMRSVDCLTISLVILAQYQRVTDRRTDEQNCCISIALYATLTRDKCYYHYRNIQEKLHIISVGILCDFSHVHTRTAAMC